jgi:hypothetical protein
MRIKGYRDSNDISGAARGEGRTAVTRKQPDKLYASGLAELDDLPPAERAALGKRLSPKDVERERLDVTEDFVALLLRDLDAHAPQEIRDALELSALCLADARAGLGLRRHTQPVLTPRTTRRRAVAVQTAEEVHP